MNKEKTPLLIALKYYGQEAVAGENTNPIIEQFYKEAGHNNIQGDDIPWCSAFMDAVHTEAGAPVSASLLARSWLEMGISTEEPELGDIVVLWRISKDSIYGHVGLFISEDKGMVYILGGNQKNMVCIAPYSKNQVLGYRKMSIEM